MHKCINATEEKVKPRVELNSWKQLGK